MEVSDFTLEKVVTTRSKLSQTSMMSEGETNALNFVETESQKIYDEIKNNEIIKENLRKKLG
jgi:hypothetical protein